MSPTPRLPAELLAYQKQLVSMQKTVFENTYNALVAFQDQQQELLERSLSQTPQLPEEAREIVATWQRAAGEGRRHFKQAVDASFGAMEQYLQGLTQDGPASDSGKQESGSE